MHIAFDVLPLIGCRMTGIGYCEAGQIQALSKMYPDDEFLLQFFSRKNEEIKIQRLQPYLRENVQPHWAKASGYVYRLVSNFLPISYRHYFGDKAEVTHFFNYIVPPKVAGKTVVTVHDMVYKTFPETVRGRTRYMLDTGLKKSMKRATRIVTDSEFSKQEIIRYFPQFADKIRVVYCGVNTERFHPVEDAATIQAVRDKYGIDREYFLYLGTVEPRKNLERLIAAYDQFRQGKTAPPYLVLAGGKGWLDSGIYKKVEELGLGDLVKFTEYVPDEEIPIRRRALPPVWNSCTPTKPCGRSCGKLVRNVRHSSRGSVLRNSCTRCIRRLAVSEQRKLRILQVNKAYYPHIGGIESLVRTFSRELQKRAEVQVLVCQEKGRGEDCVVEGVPVHYASSLGTYFSCPISFSFLRQFRKLAKWADVVEFHVPFPLADLACLLSGYRGGVVIAWHSDVVRQKTLLRFYKPLLMRFLRRADCIIAATEGHITSSPFLTQFADKCRIIPYGIDVQAYRSVERKPILRQIQQDSETVRVLFVGRFVYYKGIEVLLHAFAQVQGCELFLVGHGTPEMEEKLHQITEAAHMAAQVHFLGNLEEADLRAAFADCDIFVLPSTANSEAFGIVQQEAMVYGKPVINTALPTGVPHVSLDGVTGITVPPEDVPALAQAIQKLADDKALREQYGRAAAKRVEEEYEEADVVDKVYATLAEIAERRQRT